MLKCFSCLSLTALYIRVKNIRPKEKAIDYCEYYISSDTVSRVGVFCSLVNAIDMCKTEGVVDVFQVVKALRIQKPGAVLTTVSET